MPTGRAATAPDGSPDAAEVTPRGTGLPAAWWLAVLAAGLISAMTAPGQTAGLAAFTDPLIAELGVDRTAISFSYLVGTLTGAVAQPFIGRALDRWDARRVMIVIAVVFAAILVGLSFATDVLGLTFGFVGIRMTGQGALSLAVTTAVSRNIVHRRGFALGLSAALGSAGISLAPIGLERLVSAVGVQAAFRWEALAVLVVVPAAALLVRPQGTPAARTLHAAAQQDGWTRGEAMRTPMFWVVVGVVATTSMLGTGLTFHQIAVLGEAGLTSAEAAANFLPQTVAALASTLAVGALIDRMEPRIFLVLSMIAMAATLVMVGFVSPGWSSVLYGLALGFAGGSLRGVEAAIFVRYFGLVEIGSIRGVSWAVAIAASALGPYALAVGNDLAGNFVLPSAVLAAIPLAALVAAVLVRPPGQHPPARSV